MPPLKSNKLIPLSAAVIAIVSLGILWGNSGKSAVAAGEALKNVPSSDKDGGKRNWLTGRAAKDSKLTADGDTPNETLKTLSAQVAALQTDMRRVSDESAQVRGQLRMDQANPNAPGSTTATPATPGMTTAADPLAPIAPAASTNPVNPASQPSGLAPTPAPAANNRGLLGDGKLGGMLADLGFGGGKEARVDAPRGINPATMTPEQDMAAAGATQKSRMVLPMGYAPGKAANGTEGMIKLSPAGMPVVPPDTTRAGQAASTAGLSNDRIDPATGEVLEIGSNAAAATKVKNKPFFTIPENATLMGATAMTAIVGRVPVDGRVQDPMQFKLLLGPTNLAANGHFLPTDLAGIVVSGIAIGDMTLSCSEGVIQSMTFVFNDGTIRTVSSGAAAAQVASNNGVSGMKDKLGFLSDKYGNPCITGQFVTNAPAYLTDVVGLKTLALAGKAAASAQTTTTSSGAMGTASSTVTGSKGSYILGEAVGGATDSVTDWLTRRMGNTFDAVVTNAGAEVVIHINKEIAIDKVSNARKIDYGRIDSVSAHSHKTGVRHGLD